MFEGWTLMKKRSLQDEAAEAEPRSAVAPEALARSTQLVGGGPLDAVGQQSETVRDQVNRMAERLDDIRSLSADFELIVGPLNAFVEQYASSRSRLMEVEALLARERDLGAASRGELNTLLTSSAKTSGDLQDALSVIISRDETIGRQDTQVAELRIRVADLKSHADSLDARLSAELARAQALAGDNAALRHEVASSEGSRAVIERSLAETRESLDLSEAEAARLQTLTETLTLKISGLNRTVSDLEPQLQIACSNATLIQGKLAVEQVARQKIEASRDAERAANEMELASQAMKIDSLNAHVANTDKLIAHLRDQLHDKSEAFRIADKGLRDATAEKLSLERRLESSIEAVARAGAQLQDSQRSNVDVGNRADMLAKAVAAKDQALDGANRKSASLLDRIEGLNARFALERTEFEATHRRMIEELQNERAERSLAHGALDIARKSRSSLLAQHAALKRRMGVVDERPLDDGIEKADGLRAADSNVMAFMSPEPGS